MAPKKSLDELELIATLLRSVSMTHVEVFNKSALSRTIGIVRRRASTEGTSFLTKTLPKLGKALDKALAEGSPLNASEHRFSKMHGSKLPRFLGEFFKRVLNPDGTVLQCSCVRSIEVIRQVCYLFYKYELPYTAVQEQEVIAKFEKTEQDLETVSLRLEELRTLINNTPDTYWHMPTDQASVIRRARKVLSSLFAHFDPTNILPRHGPGAVATRQRLWTKFEWTNVAERITSMYPFDAYFCASLGHVCDSYDRFQTIGSESLPAKVILVNKDSRGPRLISCEPVDFQWIQQGLGRAIVDLVEDHPLTKWNVHFTDQRPNQLGALLGSKTGRYATLDLNEASDRVSVELVRLLFPEHICAYLEACRTTATVLPSGKVLNLRKFAPMGSSLCFPILAITAWAILNAAAPDVGTREGILVYGDDVVAPTAFAGDAIEHLESFGLKVNRDKSCTKGHFRESCGTDAYQGVEVTPIRIRTVWSSSPSPEVYTSWIAYANSFYDKQYFLTYDYIVGELCRIYGPIPSDEMSQSDYPSLRELPCEQRPIKSRINQDLQKRQWLVRVLKAPVVTHVSDGWTMLLRFFTEKGALREPTRPTVRRDPGSFLPELPFSVSSYTQRRTSMLVRRWR